MEGISMQAVFGSLLLNILNIVALFLILRALVYRPVRQFLLSRAGRIQAEADKAKAERAEAASLHEQYEAELAAAQADAEKQAAEVVARAGDAAKAIQAQAETEAKELLSRTRQQAQHERDDAMRQLKREIADISVDISARVLAREVKETDNAAIIDAYFDSAGGKDGSGADA